MPIFDARLWSALRATEVQKEIMVAQYEKAIQAVFKEVADALADKGTLGNQLSAQEGPGDRQRKGLPALQYAP